MALGTVGALAAVLAALPVEALRALLVAQFPPEARRAGAGPVCGVAVGVVLAGADLPAVAAEGVDGAGPMAVVARVARLADAGAAPWMATAMDEMEFSHISTGKLIGQDLGMIYFQRG